MHVVFKTSRWQSHLHEIVSCCKQNLPASQHAGKVKYKGHDLPVFKMQGKRKSHAACIFTWLLAKFSSWSFDPLARAAPRLSAPSSPMLLSRSLRQSRGTSGVRASCSSWAPLAVTPQPFASTCLSLDPLLAFTIAAMPARISSIVTARHRSHQT